MSLIITAIFYFVSSTGILANLSIIILVLLTKQLNSPNKILILHLSIICLSISILYLWILISNSVIPSTTKLSAIPQTNNNLETTSSNLITTIVPEVNFNTNSLNISTTVFESIELLNLESTTTIISTSETLSSLTSSSSVIPSTTSLPLSSTELPSSRCSVNDLLINILQPLSIWTICCLNFDRFYAICSPLHYNTLFTTKKVTTFLCCSYLVVFVTLFPIYFMIWFTSSGSDRLKVVCWFENLRTQFHFHKIDNSHVNESLETIDIVNENGNIDGSENFYWWEVHFLLSTILTVFLPIALVIICNVKVLTIASYQRHRIASAIFEATLSAQVAITHQKNPFFMPNLLNHNQPFFFQPKPNVMEMKKKSQKAVLIVFELIIAIIVLYCPYYIFMIVYSFYMKHKLLNNGHDEEHKHLIEKMLNILIIIVQFLLICSPTINAVLYGLKNKTIIESLQHFWRKQKTKIELHYEIQARTPSTCGSRKNSITETTNIPTQQPLLRRHLSDFFFSDNHKEMHQHYLSQNIEPLGRSSSRLSVFNSFKKYIGRSKPDLSDNGPESNAQDRQFPKILVTKYSVSIQSNQSISLRRESTQQSTITSNQETADQHEIEKLLPHSQSMIEFRATDKTEGKYQTL